MSALTGRFAVQPFFATSIEFQDGGDYVTVTHIAPDGTTLCVGLPTRIWSEFLRALGSGRNRAGEYRPLRDLN